MKSSPVSSWFVVESIASLAFCAGVVCVSTSSIPWISCSIASVPTSPSAPLSFKYVAKVFIISSDVIDAVPLNSGIFSSIPCIISDKLQASDFLPAGPKLFSFSTACEIAFCKLSGIFPPEALISSVAISNPFAITEKSVEESVFSISSWLYFTPFAALSASVGIFA